MSTKNIVIAGIIAVLCIGGISAFSISSQNSRDEQKKKDNESAMMKKKEDDKMAMKKSEDEKMAMEKKKTEEAAMMKKEDDSMVKTDVMTKESGTAGDTMKKDTETMAKTDVMVKKGSYTPYSADLVKNAENGNVVLFFNASWCPTCQSTVKNINSNLEAIPSNLTLLSTDYDKETTLKQKYGVTTQHTFVKVDKDGNLIKKASGLGTLEAIANFAK